MTTKAEILKTIRKHCLNCCCDSQKEISLCEVDCDLHQYRFGSDPNPNPKKVEQGRLHSKLHGFKAKE